MSTSPQPRRKRIVPRSFQRRLVWRFVGVAGLALALQFLLLGFFLFRAVSGLEGEGGELYRELPGVMLTVFGLSGMILLPVLFAFCVYMTFRVAGPVYRIERYLEAVVAGETQEPCRIRSGDELQELCSLINRATEPARAADKPLRRAG